MDRDMKPDLSFRPERIAQRCPVCNGWGTVKSGTKVCGGCNGRCYIIVPQTDREMDGNHEEIDYRHE